MLSNTKTLHLFVNVQCKVICILIASISNWGIKSSDIFSDLNTEDSLPRTFQIWEYLPSPERLKSGCFKQQVIPPVRKHRFYVEKFSFQKYALKQPKDHFFIKYFMIQICLQLHQEEKSLTARKSRVLPSQAQKKLEKLQVHNLTSLQSSERACWYDLIPTLADF